MTDTEQKLGALQQALQLTETMLASAKQHNWDDLASLEKQRQLLLEVVFPISDTSTELETFSSVLQTLIDTNHQLIAHCQQGKHSLQLQMRDTKFNKKAVTAYQSS